MSYQVFLTVHIISYIVWLAAFAGSMFFAWKVGKHYEDGSEAKYMKLERTTTSIGAHLGALGILISGGAMVSIPSGPQWGWFNFSLYAWLGTKQVIFLIILVLVVFSIKKGVAFKKQRKQDATDLVSEAARTKWSKAYKFSLIIYVLVVVNTILGLTKPF